MHGHEPHCQLINWIWYPYAGTDRSDARHSSILQFEWYEPIYYKTEERHFPSMSNEKSGRFVGVSEHVGHTLTFMVLTDDTQTIIH